MKLLLTLLVVFSSLSLQAETVKFNFKAECENVIESTIPNYLKQLHLTKICTQNSALLNAETKCTRDNYGKVVENRITNTQCQTKIFYKNDQKYNRIQCQSTTRAVCKI